MAATIVVVKLETELVDAVMKLSLKGGDGTILNGAGDELTEDTTRKCYYTATIDEAITGNLDVTIEDVDGDGIGAFDLIGLTNTVGPFYCEEPSSTDRKLDTTLQVDGANYQFTEAALELAPAGTGGGGGDCPTVEEISDEIWANVPTEGVYITVASPILPSGDIEIVAGDDYYNADGRAIPFTIVGFPSIVGATIHFSVHEFDGGEGVAVLSSVVGVPVDATHAYVELSNTQTSLLIPDGNYRYDLQATLVGSSHKVTLGSGSLTSKYSWTPPS